MNRKIFDIKYPIIQAPMAGGILTADFVAKVSNRGLLGFIPGGYLTINKLEEFIVTVKSSLSAKNYLFGVNIFLEGERYTEETLAVPDNFEEVEISIGLDHKDIFITPKTIPESDYIELFIKHSVPIVSCTFGFFSPYSINKLKASGIKIIGNATNLQEFEYCCNHGADAVVLQGNEAGGHQASFLSNEVNLNKTRDLICEVRLINNKTTIIASGGISSNNYKEYLAIGADYIQMGTAFMMTTESNLSLSCKNFIISANSTELTNNITGKWARGIKNKLFALTQNKLYYDFPYQHYLTSAIRQEAKKQDNPEYISLWAGQNTDNYILRNLDNLIEDLIISEL